MNQVIDEGLKQFATETQSRYIDAVNQHGSQRAAATALGTGASTIDSAIQRVKANAARRGWSPQHDMTKVVPEPFVVKGISTYYDKEGKAAGQWVKSTLDQNKHQEMMLAAIEAMKEEIYPVKPVAAPVTGHDKLCNCYVITDYHLGMLSWEVETGANWDIGIAEEMLVRWFQQAIAQSPSKPCSICPVVRLLAFRRDGRSNAG